MPAHHALQDWLDAYLDAAGIGDDAKGVLFRTSGRRSCRLIDKSLSQADAYRMIQRRAAATWPHVSTAIPGRRGITAYLENGDVLKHSQTMRRMPRPARPSFMTGPGMGLRSKRWRGLAFNEITLYKVETISNRQSL